MEYRVAMIAVCISTAFAFTSEICVAIEEGGVNVISSTRGTRVVSLSSYYSEKWSAENLIDAKNETGWCSEKGAVFPHVIVFELVDKAEIDLIRQTADFNPVISGIHAPAVETPYHRLLADYISLILQEHLKIPGAKPVLRPY